MRQTKPGRHQCGCLLKANDKCIQMVESPDQPICDDCEKAKHPERKDFSMVLPGKEADGS